MAIKFRNTEHKNRFYEILERMSSGDEYHTSVAYLLALDNECYNHIDSLFDFEENLIKPYGALQQAWQTGTSTKTTRLMFNLWCSACEEENQQTAEISNPLVKELAKTFPADTAEQLYNAFEGAKMADWDSNQAKINRVKRALYNILGNEEQTESAFAVLTNGETAQRSTDNILDKLDAVKDSDGYRIRCRKTVCGFAYHKFVRRVCKIS